MRDLSKQYGITTASADNSTSYATTAFLALYGVRNDIAQSLSVAQQTQALGNIGLATGYDGCCRLSVASTTSLVLKPYGGNVLWIAGQPCTIPSAGVSISNGSLLASTLYYVYALGSGGVVTSLSLMTSGHITGSDGREYANASGSANTNYRLVGMALTGSSVQFADVVTFRGIANFFNRRERVASSSGNNVGSSSTSAVALDAVTSFLAWADEDVVGGLSGSAANGTAGQYCTSILAVDGSSVAQTTNHTASANYQNDAGLFWGATLAEGSHTAVFNGLVSGGTGSWYSIMHTIRTRM